MRLEHHHRYPLILYLQSAILNPHIPTYLPTYHSATYGPLYHTLLHSHSRLYPCYSTQRHPSDRITLTQYTHFAALGLAPSGLSLHPLAHSPQRLCLCAEMKSFSPSLFFHHFPPFFCLLASFTALPCLATFLAKRVDLLLV